MTWLTIVLAFQLGWYPTAQFMGSNPPTNFIDGSGQFYQKAEIKAIIAEHFEVGGSMLVHDWRVEQGFFPDQLNSVFFINAIWGPFTLGYQHECLHPVVPWHANPTFDAASDQFFVRLELKWSP